VAEEAGEEGVEGELAAEQAVEELSCCVFVFRVVAAAARWRFFGF